MKKLSPVKIVEAITENAKIIKRKEEIYKEVIKLNKELEVLEETYIGMVGSFGFASPNDKSNVSKTGFVNDFQNISKIADLEREMGTQEPINEDTIDEMDRLKKENEELKKQLEETKTKK